MGPDTGDLLALINNDTWMIRHYERGGRTQVGRLKREQAILKLWLTLGHAFDVCPKAPKDIEAVLGTLLDGLRPRNERPF